MDGRRWSDGDEEQKEKEPINHGVDLVQIEEMGNWEISQQTTSSGDVESIWRIKTMPRLQFTFNDLSNLGWECDGVVII